MRIVSGSATIQQRVATGRWALAPQRDDGEGTTLKTGTTSSSARAETAPPDDWVPADRRWAGFDRRTIGPALFVLAFMLLMHFGLPALNSAVAYDDRIEAGDDLSLTQGITFTPVPGWNLEDGLERPSPKTASPWPWSRTATSRSRRRSVRTAAMREHSPSR